MASEMNLADELGRNVVEPGRGVVRKIVCADRDVVDVDQQLAAAAAGQLAKKAGLAPLVIAERQIMRWVLDEDLAIDRVLHAFDIRAESAQHLVRARYRQKVWKAAPVEARPGEMLG